MYAWTRAELKKNGRFCMNRSYWKCLLTALILTISIAGFGYFGGVSSRMDAGGADFLPWHGLGLSSVFPWSLTAAIAVGAVALSLIGLAIRIALLQPLEVNCRRVLIINRVQNPDLSGLGYTFSNGYGNVVKTQFLRYLFTFLWTCLLIVPGIIKTYEYRMIPFILAENPEIDSKEAFRLSRTMMDGEKWKTFVLDLSFLGWHILSLFTVGLLDLLYTNPYEACTNTELYTMLKTTKLFPNS
jgi:uncharacterized membrane protein